MRDPWCGIRPVPDPGFNSNEIAVCASRSTPTRGSFTTIGDLRRDP
jgi:hypothetical protein